MTDHPIIFPSGPGKTRVWKARTGELVKKGEPLIDVQYNDLGRNVVTTITSDVNGTFKKILIKNNQSFQAGESLGIISVCRHDIQLRGFCVICNMDVSHIEAEITSSTIDQENPGLIKEGKEYAEEKHNEMLQELVEQEKLYMILDLDLTILHTTLAQSLPNHFDLAFYDDVYTFTLADNTFYVKFRPGLKDFLLEILKIYEIHVYTMGTKEYADQIVRIINVNVMGLKEGDCIFKGRQFTRDQNLDIDLKRLSNILHYGHGDKIAVILDDREDVWSLSSGNLISVLPYKFWKGQGDINDPLLLKEKNEGDLAFKNLKFDDDDQDEETSPKKRKREDDGDEVSPVKKKKLELSEAEPIDSDTEKAQLANPIDSYTQKAIYVAEKLYEEDKDTLLLSLYRTLEKIQRCFYQDYKENNVLPDIREIIGFLKSEVLSGCHIYFSGVFPVGFDKNKESLWQKAVSFGAKLYDEYDDKITHLVINRVGTEKLTHALDKMTNNIYIVNLEWLVQSLANWHKYSEMEYPFGSVPVCPREKPDIEVPLPAALLAMFDLDDFNLDDELFSEIEETKSESNFKQQNDKLFANDEDDEMDEFSAPFSFAKNNNKPNDIFDDEYDTKFNSDSSGSGDFDDEGYNEFMDFF